MNPTENGTSLFFITLFCDISIDLKGGKYFSARNFFRALTFLLTFLLRFRKFWLTSWAWNAEIYQNKEHKSTEYPILGREKAEMERWPEFIGRKMKFGHQLTASWAHNDKPSTSFFIPKLGPINHVNVQLVARRLRITAKRPFMIASNSSRIQNPFCMFSLKTQSPKV